MATMKEVAKIAGVSTATVSRALMTPEKVSNLTRQKVESAVTQSGYSPNIFSRHHRKGHTKTLIAILPDICDPYFSKVMAGMQECAIHHGYTLLFTNASDALKTKLETLYKQVDGILLLASNLASHMLEHHKYCPPVVMACEFDPEFELPTVHIDNLTASFQVVNYLTQMGHTKIAQITGPLNTNTAKFRDQGFHQAMQRLGIAINPNYQLEGDLSYDSGAYLCQKLLTMPNPPTAIFCHNDIMAIGALKRAKQLGFQVPQDISIIGFDNLDMAEYCDPPLTTVNQPRYEIGKQALLLLLDAITGQETPSGSRLLNAEIVIRETTTVVKN